MTDAEKQALENVAAEYSSNWRHINTRQHFIDGANWLDAYRDAQVKDEGDLATAAYMVGFERGRDSKANEASLYDFSCCGGNDDPLIDSKPGDHDYHEKAHTMDCDEHPGVTPDRTQSLGRECAGCFSNPCYCARNANEASAVFQLCELSPDEIRAHFAERNIMGSDAHYAARWGFGKGRVLETKSAAQVVLPMVLRIQDLEAKLADSVTCDWVRENTVNVVIYNSRKEQLDEAQAEIERLKREVDVLRIYGNKTATAMADEALKAKTSAES